MKITHTEDVIPLRRAAYPPIEEFADAMYWKRQGDPTKLEAYFNAIEKVKREFPKL
jgi:hypothetical protein